MRPASQLAMLLAVALMVVGRGQSKNGRIQVIPANADAKDFPGAVVPVMATDVGNVTWCIGTSSGPCNGNVIATASLDSPGRAQCIQGRSGTVTVLAGTGLSSGLPDTGANSRSLRLSSSVPEGFEELPRLVRKSV